MTQIRKHSSTTRNGILGATQNGARSTAFYAGDRAAPSEDFSRTIRSYCMRVVSPPFGFLAAVRRRGLQPVLGGALFKAPGTTRNFNPGNGTMSKKPDNTIIKPPAARQLAACLAIFTLALPAAVTPAYAVISNTVTVMGTAPGGTPDAVTDQATENVDVDDAAPVLAVTKVATIGGSPVDGTTDDAAAGTVITYTYTVTNTGNVGVTNVSLSDDHGADADGSLTTITLGSLTPDGVGDPSTDDSSDNDWDYLAPGDQVSWTASYTVTQVDINSQSANGDGTLDNTVTASGGYEDSSGNPATVQGTASEAVDLEDVNASLVMAKAATVGGTPVDGTNDNVAVGTTITYTYTITNNGNVPISNITLNDVFNGSGTFTQPNPDISVASLTDNSGGGSSDTSGDSAWDVLAPLDVLTIVTTYVVTQSDVDNLQ